MHGAHAHAANALFEHGGVAGNRLRQLRLAHATMEKDNLETERPLKVPPTDQISARRTHAAPTDRAPPTLMLSRAGVETKLARPICIANNMFGALERTHTLTAVASQECTCRKASAQRHGADRHKKHH